MPPTRDAPPAMIGIDCLSTSPSEASSLICSEVRGGTTASIQKNIPATIRIIPAPRRPRARNREIIPNLSRKAEEGSLTLSLANSPCVLGGYIEIRTNPWLVEVEQKRGKRCLDKDISRGIWLTVHERTRRTEEMAESSDPRQIRLRSFGVVSLVALALSVAIWGAVYLLTAAGMR